MDQFGTLFELTGSFLHTDPQTDYHRCVGLKTTYTCRLTYIRGSVISVPSNLSQNYMHYI